MDPSTSSPGGLRDLFRFLQRWADRYLTDYVLALLHSQDGRLGVEGVGQGDGNYIYAGIA